MSYVFRDVRERKHVYIFFKYSSAREPIQLYN